jgi:metallo-beta-lactamase class B
MRPVLLIALILFLFSNSTCAQSTHASLKISHLTDDFYIFTTYNEYKGAQIPSNSMYMVTDKGVVLFDTPWDTTQFQPLLDSIEARHHKPVILCIATHFHDDKTAGLGYYRRKGIKTYTTTLTDEWSNLRGKQRAEFLITKDTAFTVGQYTFQTFYPGHGHTADNIVLWFPNQKILYGGCLIKSTEDDNLGNLADASVKDYATTIKNVMKKCPDPKFVIPGHGDWSSTKSLAHTLMLAKKLQK